MEEGELVVKDGPQQYRLTGRVARMVRWLIKAEQDHRLRMKGKIIFAFSGGTVNAECTDSEPV